MSSESQAPSNSTKKQKEKKGKHNEFHNIGSNIIFIAVRIYFLA